MRRPRRRYGPNKRTAKERRASLVQLLSGCKPEMLSTFTAERLAALSGVPANDCAAMLEEARVWRG
jgi:hypothetical protein